jgi:hypothetical protein
MSLEVGPWLRGRAPQPVVLRFGDQPQIPPYRLLIPLPPPRKGARLVSRPESQGEARPGQARGAGDARTCRSMQSAATWQGGLVIVDIDGPGEGEVDELEDGTKVVLVRSLG